MPGFSRPKTCSHLPRRSSSQSKSGVACRFIIVGIQTDGTSPQSIPWKPWAATPTTVIGCVLIENRAADDVGAAAEMGSPVVERHHDDRMRARLLIVGFVQEPSEPRSNTEDREIRAGDDLRADGLGAVLERPGSPSSAHGRRPRRRRRSRREDPCRRGTTSGCRCPSRGPRTSRASPAGPDAPGRSPAASGRAPDRPAKRWRHSRRRRGRSTAAPSPRTPDPSAASESPAGHRAAGGDHAPVGRQPVGKGLSTRRLETTILRRIPSTAIEDARSNTVGGSGTGLVVGVVKVTT